MKKIILSLFGVMCFVGAARAEYTYLITQSTCFFVTSATNSIEVLSVEISSGNNKDFCLLIDTIPLASVASGEYASVAVRDNGVYPVSQWMTTQMLALDTSTLQSPHYWNFQDSKGDGLRPKKGLFIWQSAIGNTVKLRLRKHR